MKAESHWQEIIRFGIVGMLALGIHYGIYILLLVTFGLDWSASLGIDWRTNLAYTLGYIVSLMCNLWLSAHFTFQEKITFKRSGGFFISHAINYLIHVTCLNFFLLLGVVEWLAPLLVLLIAVPINFILVRFSFKRL